MATNTTIKTQIVVQFDDQFSDAANRANEKYFKSFEEAHKKAQEIRANFKPFYEDSFEDIRKAFNELDALHKVLASISVLVPIAFGIVHPTAFIISLTAASIALTSFYGLWLSGEKLKGWMVEGQPIDKYVEGVKESLDQFSDLEFIGLPPIPAETVQSLEDAKSCLQQIQKLQDIFITVDLVDNATKEAKQMRQEIEGIFSKDIIQRIKIIEEKTQLTTPSFFGGSDSIFNDSSIELQTPSPDLSGFGDAVSTSSNSSTGTNFPGFSSGIERVPRDMLAMIHKDEAVSPKNQAEEFRRGGSNGITIQKLDFSLNVPNGLKLDREEFRNLAFQMRDELKRLDQRMN